MTPSPKMAMRSFFARGQNGVSTKKAPCENLAGCIVTSLVRLAGLEPARALAHHPLKMARLPFRHNRIYGASGQDRTVDTRIFSPLLYRLSYRGTFR